MVQGKAIVITSGKGGTGKTSVVAGVGSCLAAMGHQVLCLDADIGLRNLDLVLGLSDRAIMDFSDVIERRCPLEDAAVPHPDIKGLYLLTAPMTADYGVSQALPQLVGDICQIYDYCLIDSPAGIGSGFTLAAEAADRAIVVSTTDPSSLRDAQSATARLRHYTRSIHLVVNRVQPRLLRKLHSDIDDAMDLAGLPLLGVIPEDQQVAICGGQGVPIIMNSGRGAARAYCNIAKRITGQRVPSLRC